MLNCAAAGVNEGLALKPVARAANTVLAKLFGGQGTINVPSWSPDGSKLAFVSYTLSPK
jgi:TolB protein